MISRLAVWSGGLYASAVAFVIWYRGPSQFKSSSKKKIPVVKFLVVATEISNCL